MAIQIEDGHGSGIRAKINAEGFLDVNAVAVFQEQHINELNNKVWSIPFEGLNPAGTDDYVIYIENTGDKIINVSDIRISADTAATQVEVQVVTGTPVGGSAITPVSRTIAATATPTATVESGTDITGLTTGGVLFFIQCAVVNTEYHLETTSKIRLSKGKAIALLVETATANITGVITLVEEL